MLKDFRVRFYDNKDHPEGTIVIVSALDKGQAMQFADMIASSLDIKWKSEVDWEFWKDDKPMLSAFY